MRSPLITPLASRDGTVEKDEKLVNCFGEVDPETGNTQVIKRSGLSEGDAVITGNDIYAQGMFSYDGYYMWAYGDVLGWVWVTGTQHFGSGGSISFGVDEWDISVTYDIGDPVYHNGSFYYSYSDNNVGNQPPNALWGATAPGSSRYQGTITWGGTGELSASVASAGYSAYLACPYDSCPNRRTDTNQWLTYDSMSGNNIRCHAYGVYAPDYCSGGINDFGVSTYGTVTQIS